MRTLFGTKAGLLLAIFSPAICAYVILFRCAFPVPYQDDYHAIVDFAVKYEQAATWKAKALEIIAEQHNEYKLVLEHCLIASELQLTRHLNFRFLTTLGNLLLIPIAWLLWCIHKDENAQSKHAVLAFLPVSLLLFSLSYWETLNWAMAELENLPVILFALLSLRLLFSNTAPSPLRPLIASLSGVCAAFSLANGFLLAPIGLSILARRKAFGAATVWCISFLFASAVYGFGYVPIYREPPTNLGRVLSFFCFLGSAVPSTLLAFILGIGLAIIFVLSIRHRFYHTHPVTFCSALWVFLTAALVAWVRGAVSSRYSIYSILLFIFAYQFLSHHLQRRVRELSFNQVFAPSVALALVLCISADTIALLRLEDRRKMVLAGMNAYLKNPACNSPQIDPHVLLAFPGEAESERATLNSAIRRRVFDLPNQLSSR